MCFVSFVADSTPVPVDAVVVAGATIGVLLFVVMVMVIVCGVAGFLVYRRRWRKHSSSYRSILLWHKLQKPCMSAMQ